MLSSPKLNKQPFFMLDLEVFCFSNNHVHVQNFIDLAGSERASQAMSAGARLKEGCHINRSLLTLGTVIRKLRFVNNTSLNIAVFRILSK